MYQQSKKKLLNSNTSSTCPHNTANFCPLTYLLTYTIAAEIAAGVWGTAANFNGFRVLASLLQRRRSPEANETLHDVWPFHGLLHYYTFSGVLPPDGISPRAKFTLRPSLVLAALLHGTPAAGVSQTLRRGTRNGITELSQRAPPIFSRAIITLGIGPHCSYLLPCTVSEI